MPGWLGNHMNWHSPKEDLSATNVTTRARLNPLAKMYSNQYTARRL